MKNNRIIPKSKLFRKVFLWNVSITVIFIIIMASVSIRFSSRFILNNTMKFNQESLVQRTSIFDDRIRQLEDIVNVVVEQKEVLNYIFKNQNMSAQPMELRGIVLSLQNICQNNSILSDISLVNFEKGIVMDSNAMRNIEETDFSEDVLKKDGLHLNQSDSSFEIWYTKKFSPLSRQGEIYLVLTLKNSAFFEDLLSQEKNRDQNYEEYILTEDKIGLSENKVHIFDETMMKALANMGEESFQMESAGENLLIYKEQAEMSDWSVVWIQDYTNLKKQSRWVMKMIIVSSIIMLLLAVFLIYLCSLWLYKPIRQFGAYIKKKIPYEVKNENDEILMAEDVVDWLSKEKDMMFEKYQNTLPVLIQSAVYKLIVSEYDAERFEYLKRITNRQMNKEYFVLLLHEAKDQNDNRIITEKIENALKKQLKIEGFYAYLTPEQMIWIINFDMDFEQLLNQLRQIKEEETGEIESVWYISRVFKNMENINLIYSELYKKQFRKFYKGQNAFIYEESDVQILDGGLEKHKIQSELIQTLKSGEKEKIKEHLHAFTKSMAEKRENTAYIRFQYFDLCRRIIGILEEQQVRIFTQKEEKELFDSIFNAENIVDLEERTEEILLSQMGQLEGTQESYSPNVKKAIQFVNEHYGQDLSLDDVAKSTGLSEGYLSSIFKAETGDTIYEYITKIRMQKARELLSQNQEMKIREISDMLGYNNIQSFIRYFKKYYGMTPAEYRKSAEDSNKEMYRKN